LSKARFVRYELPNIAALNFVMAGALGGGVTRSLALDAHGQVPEFGAARSGNRKRLQTTNSRSSSHEAKVRCQTLRHSPRWLTISHAAHQRRKLVDECLARIADTSGEGVRAFILSMRKQRSKRRKRWTGCREWKAARRHSRPFPFRSRTCSTIKGQVTRAGSRALDDSAPAEADGTRGGAVRRAASS